MNHLTLVSSNLQVVSCCLDHSQTVMASTFLPLTFVVVRLTAVGICAHLYVVAF